MVIKIVKSENKKTVVANILLLIILMFYVVAQILIQSDLLRNGMIGLLGLIAYMYSWINCKQSVKNQVFKLSLIFSLFMFISIAFTGNATLLDIIWIWSYMGISFLIYNFNISYKIAAFSYYAVSAIYILEAMMRRDSTYIFVSSSRNAVSATIIFYMCLYYLLKHMQTNKIPFLPAVLSFIVCIWGQGRSGVIVSLYFIAIIAFYLCFLYSKHKVRNMLFMTVAIYAGYRFLINIFSSQYQAVLTRFEERGLNSLRSDIYAEYISGTVESLSNFLFGTPYSSGHWLNIYQNPHNSWLYLHSNFGIAGFIIINILLLYFVYQRMKYKEIFVLMIFSTLFLRSMFDLVAFPGMFDAIYWLFILYALNNRRERE